MQEKTLVLLKPDALQRGLVGEIIHRFERVGLKMVGLKLLVSPQELAERHYTEDLAKRRGDKVRQIMIKTLMSGPIIAIAFEGVEAVELVRKMVGTTEPKQAAPGTIRGDFAHVSFDYADKKDKAVFNLIHASSDQKSAEEEIKVWFDAGELIQHDPLYTKYTL